MMKNSNLVAAERIILLGDSTVKTTTTAQHWVGGSGSSSRGITRCGFIILGDLQTEEEEEDDETQINSNGITASN